MKDASDPLALVEFYRDLNTTVSLFQETLTVEEFHRLASSWRKQLDPYHLQDRALLVADVGLTDHEPRRRAWREAIRKRPNTKILEDKPGYLIALLH